MVSSLHYTFSSCCAHFNEGTCIIIALYCWRISFAYAKVICWAYCAGNGQCTFNKGLYILFIQAQRLKVTPTTSVLWSLDGFPVMDVITFPQNVVESIPPCLSIGSGWNTSYPPHLQNRFSLCLLRLCPPRRVSTLLSLDFTGVLDLHPSRALIPPSTVWQLAFSHSRAVHRSAERVGPQRQIRDECSSPPYFCWPIIGPPESAEGTARRRAHE